MTISLRPEQPDDGPFLRHLITTTISQELGADFWPEPMRSHLLGVQYSARCQFFRDRFPTGESSIILLDGVAAGWLCVAALADEVRLAEIMILPEHRGKGAGTAVIRRVVENAGDRPVRLSVNALNTNAARLYERMGFRRIGGDEVQHLMEHPAGATC
ncbi:putative Acetyltransferase [Candidatus Sulfopaludibacter sp. SbA3]|nr:putative Acetyltransferase [Candidatus Sulfopaludibacter sp. SbA3]